MAHSVEARFPFLDHRVVEFAASLPPAVKMKGLQEKYLLKQCVQGLVPPAVSDRHKQPYRAPEAQSFFPGGQPLDYVADLLTPEQIRRDGIFEPAAVKSLMQKACDGRIIGIRDNMAVVGIISTALLIRRFLTDFSLDQQGGRDLNDGYHGKFAAIRH
jgi:asparagine synthase (glutamine-hydrolysing)